MCIRDSNNNDGVAIPLTKGARLIIIHAGGEIGFIENCFTMWKSRDVYKRQTSHRSLN